MVSSTTTSHICLAVVSLLVILGQVAQCMSLPTYTDNDDFPVQQDATQNDDDVWQQMAMVILTRALQTLSDKMATRLQPLDKRGNLFWRTGVLGRPGNQGKK